MAWQAGFHLGGGVFPPSVLRRGESPETKRAKEMLMAEVYSAVPSAANIQIDPDTSFVELKHLAQKCIDCDVTLQHFEAATVASQAQLFDVPKLHAVLGTTWEQVQANFERILTQVLRNEGSGPNGVMTFWGAQSTASFSCAGALP